MKRQFLKIIDFLIFIFSFLLLLSTYFKLLSITFSNNEDNFIVLLWIVGICLASKFTRPLYQEILALRLPVERWLQMHHLK